MQTVESQESMFFQCDWFPSEMRLLAPPEDVTTAEWAERHRHVVKSERPGPWRNENNPALTGIMNAADRKGLFKNMRTLVIQKGVQTGVTEGAHNILFKRMDGRAHNALIVMESERKMRRIFKQRIIDGIRRSVRLASQMSGNPDDTTNYSILMRTGFCLNIGWSGSQSSVASDPCALVVLDEIDKYDSPINIVEAKDRTTTYRETGLSVILSTPGTEGGPITTEMALCDAVFEFRAICPDCGNAQAMNFEHFWYPGKGEPQKPGGWKKLANRVERERLGRYACAGCGVLWDDYTRDRALKLGTEHGHHGWHMREQVSGPVSAGFYFPSWLSLFKSLSDVAARWLRAQEPGQAALLQMWHNNEAAEPFVESVAGEGLAYEAVYAKRERYGPQIPMAAAVLTAAADVQTNRIEAEVVAWGRGEESWGVEFKIFAGDTKRPDVWKEFDAWRKKTFLHESGVDLRIACVCIDTGDGNTTKQACDFIRPRQSQRVYGVKGSSRPGQPVVSARPSFKNKGGIALFFAGTDTAKSTIYSNLLAEDHGPGYMHYHHGYDEEYFRQLTVEKVVTRYQKGFTKRTWEKPPGARNEALDIRVYNLAALEILKTYRDFDLSRLVDELAAKATARDATIEQHAQPAPSVAQAKTSARKKGGWMKGWK